MANYTKTESRAHTITEPAVMEGVLVNNTPREITATEMSNIIFNMTFTYCFAFEITEKY